MPQDRDDRRRVGVVAAGATTADTGRRAGPTPDKSVGDDDGSVTVTWLAKRLPDRSARGLAAGVTALVRSGQLRAGVRLPTVRLLADELGVSPGTVSAAWRLLARRRIVATGRRRGTVVLGIPAAPHPQRFETVGNFGARSPVDLSLAVPDPGLLPDLSQALAAGLANEQLHAYTREPITEALRAAVAPRWPFPAQEWVAVNGGYEGLLTVCRACVAPGEPVAVEEPTAPRVLDILEAADAQLLPVGCDAHGPVPDRLAEAVAAGAVAFVYQPRAQSPAGHSLSAERVAQLADVLSGSGVLVVENDGVGDTAMAPLRSVGEYLAEQTVVVRSFSKTHGPDLRLAVLAGAADPVERVRGYRNFGASWSSRILQDALAHLLTDGEAEKRVRAARRAYTERRTRLLSALAEQGIALEDRDGLSLWVPVHDERYALVTLAAHGIAVSPGSRFYVRSGPPHLRVATSRLVDGYEQVAHALMLATGR